MNQETLQNFVANTLADVRERVEHPERFSQAGIHLRHVYGRPNHPLPALHPEDRLQAMLELVLVVKTWEAALLKEIVADTAAHAAYRDKVDRGDEALRAEQLDD